MADDYVNLVGDLMYPRVSAGQFGYDSTTVRSTARIILLFGGERRGRIASFLTGGGIVKVALSVCLRSNLLLSFFLP